MWWYIDDYARYYFDIACNQSQKRATYMFRMIMYKLH